MTPVFERMRFSRSVPLFAEIPGEDPRMVAEILDTVEHEEGAVVLLGRRRAVIERRSPRPAPQREEHREGHGHHH